MPARKKKLSQSDLRLLGATPGLMSRRIGPDGHARLEELTPAKKPPGKPPGRKGEA